MSDQLHYVYAVVPPRTPVEVAPRGIDERDVTLVVSEDLAALVSAVDASIYGSDLDDRLPDVGWIAPRATAHDAVLTWASDLGPVVPLPLLSLFRTREAVEAMLGERRDELRALLASVARGREYGVRIFRIDDELSRSLASYSEQVRRLESEASAASSPGQAYLLTRKVEQSRKDELRRVGQEVAAAAYGDLSLHALASVQEPLPKPAAEQIGHAVLNAWFLVAHDRLDDFRAAVTEFLRTHDRRGFRVEFTGPWPPYHFTRSERDGR